MQSAEALSGGSGTDIGGLNTGSGSRARTGNTRASETDAATEAQRLRSEGARESRAGRGGCGDGRGNASVSGADVSIDLAEVLPPTRSPRPSAKRGTGGGGRSATARATDVSPLREDVVFSAEHGTEVPSERLAAYAAPLDVPLLTTVEEQKPHDSASDIPAVVVLRHRMGCSMVVLAPHQRASYSRCDLENFVLYKEQKYNAVNVLWRFCILMLLVLSFSVFCLVLCACTTEWLSVQNNDSFLSVGLFFSCRDGFQRTCTSWQSAWLEWIVVDNVTGATLCRASAGFVRRFLGVMWTMGILQLLCEVVALFLGFRIAARPTRSGALVLLFFDLLLSLCMGIVTVVLFDHYTSCVRRTCEGEHVSGDVCNVHYRYGYRLYIGAVSVHGLLLVLALSMHCYIYNIRVTSRNQLRAERHRISRSARAEDYTVHILNSSITSSVTRDAAGGSCARSTWDAARTTSQLDGNRSTRQPSIVASVPSSATAIISMDAVAGPPNSRRRGDQDGGEDDGANGDALRSVDLTSLQPAAPAPDTFLAGGVDFNVQSAHRGSGFGIDTATTAASTSPTPGSLPLQHGELHVSFLGVPDDTGDDAGFGLLSGSQSRRYRQHPSVSTLSFDDGGARAAATAAATAAFKASDHNTDSSFVARGRSVGAAVAADGDNAQRPRRDRQRASPGDSSLPRTGRQRSAGPQTEATESSLSSKQKQGLSDKRPAAAVYQQARKRQHKFLRFFNREYDSNYLTAAELGVLIAGATDWVYDDRSDMYYSFDRNMFWDPLTQEYYNCALKSWQESPDQAVEVRDMLDYILESPASSCSRRDSRFNHESNENSLMLMETTTSIATDGDDVNSSGGVH
ncbi:conserved hypothetical protein [Leishmania major strain Friedlin]|uniref:Transmembrane protein n=1 Tax=Leishmania major TaxID=5664 RepID=E9ADI7_LEIMA|nr:conserved hypothetical protein [Leishmania major strain Friedlin]CAG9576819.1 hypothetical_protein_-_conserved [Leishmania major strain Friedlin]CBZ12277.1 conserved hypothetical protein [Leishmania major strain Friedlin]|eukprot:XP_003722016.1 conserved hypothetical protein [Leishmania major strain Friedlin]